MKIVIITILICLTLGIELINDEKQSGKLKTVGQMKLILTENEMSTVKFNLE